MVLTSRICAITVALYVTAAPALATAQPGSVETRIGPLGSSDRVLSVDTAGSDRIVIAGITNGYPLYHPWVRAFRPDGIPDPTFGGGDGFLEFEDSRRQIRALVLGDGRTVVVQGGGGYWDPQPHAITRLNLDGTPDEGFGTSGSIQPDFGGRYGTFLSDVVADRAGRLIVVGSVNPDPTSPTTFVVRRYLADGSPETSFGTNGETTLQGDPQSSAAGTLAPDGGIVLSFPVDGYPTVAHLSADGRLDGSFTGKGTAPMQLADPKWRDNVRRIWTGRRPVVLPGGRVRVPVAFTMPHEKEFRIAVVGLTANGHPDLGYGFRGIAIGPRPAPGGETPDAAVADPGGSVIVAGSHWSDDDFSFEDSAMIRRFRPDGSLDRSFGDHGLVPAALGGQGYTTFTHSLALLGPDRLVAAEYTVDAKYQFWEGTALRTINAGYDRDNPSISIAVQGCRRALVHIGDTLGIEAVVRVNGRVTRRTTLRSFRVRTRRGGSRVTVQATDLAENGSIGRARLPRC